MGPIEIVFIVMVLVFGVIGIVRGYPRELGVTNMLLIALFVLEFMNERLSAKMNALLSSQWQAVVACGFLLVIAFISYEGDTLAFAGKGKNTFFSLGAGLLNGYLFAGSLWYYLEEAKWLGLPNITLPYTRLHDALYQLLPPAIFTWPFLILLAVLMLIMRVWK